MHIRLFALLRVKWQVVVNDDWEVRGENIEKLLTLSVHRHRLQSEEKGKKRKSGAE